MGFTLLVDPDGGHVLGVTLFATEEDLTAGSAVLDEMSPPGEGLGQRVSVDVYEVAVDLRAE